MSYIQNGPLPLNTSEDVFAKNRVLSSTPQCSCQFHNRHRQYYLMCCTLTLSFDVRMTFRAFLPLPSTASHSGIAFSHHVSLASSHLGPFHSLSLFFFVTLTLLRATGPLFVNRTFLIWGLAFPCYYDEVMPSWPDLLPVLISFPMKAHYSQEPSLASCACF